MARIDAMPETSVLAPTPTETVPHMTGILVESLRVSVLSRKKMIEDDAPLWAPSDGCGRGARARRVLSKRAMKMLSSRARKLRNTTIGLSGREPEESTVRELVVFPVLSVVVV